MRAVDTGHLLERHLMSRLNRTAPSVVLPSTDLLERTIETVKRRRPAVSSGPQALSVLARTTESDRREILVDVLRQTPAEARPFSVWSLGNGFFEMGHYGLAAAAFLHGSLLESQDPLVRAALLIKAGWSINDGALGAWADQFLVTATMMLDRATDGDPTAIALARFMAHYTHARYFLFLDAYKASAGHIREAKAALNDEASALLDPDGTGIPDLPLFEARIARNALEVAGEGSLEEVEAHVDALAACTGPLVLHGSSLRHHLAFQRASLLRLQQRHDDARAQAEIACEALASLTIDAAVSASSDDLANVNKRRLGYVLCLAGEIEPDSSPTEVQQGIRYFDAANRAWMDPYFGRGLSRATRLHALALMKDGRRWSEASRLLTESIAHASGSQQIAAEARAVAAKIALHTSLQHDERAARYSSRLAQIRSAMAGHWHTHRALDALTRGYARPRTTSDSPLDNLTAISEASGLVGAHPSFLRCLQMAKVVASTSATVLITGELGTGKTELARFIHNLSERSHKPFRDLSLAELPNQLADGVLFGYEKDIHSRARKTTTGEFEDADGGTVFLDDINATSRAVQRKILRVIDKKLITRVGGKRNIGVNVRIIAAANEDLDAAVAAGGFRGDLLSRLRLITVHLPPLRERVGDIPLLAKHLLERAKTLRATESRLSLEQQLNLDRVKGFSTASMQELCSAPWTENIRELWHTIYRLMLVLPLDDVSFEYVNADGEISSAFLHQYVTWNTAEIQDEVLHTKIPLWPAQVRAHLTTGQFKDPLEFAKYLKAQFPRYPSQPESLVRLMKQKPSFERVLDGYFER